MIKRTIITLAVCALSAAFLHGCTDNADTTDVSGAPTAEISTEAEATEAPESVSLKMVYNTVRASLGSDYLANMKLQKDAFCEKFGISEQDMEDFEGDVSLVEDSIDTLAIVKAKQGRVSAVENALLQYKADLQADTEQYPVNRPKINASVVKTYGDYAVFIMLGTAESEEEAELEQLAAANNKKATDALDILFDTDSTQNDIS